MEKTKHLRPIIFLYDKNTRLLQRLWLRIVKFDRNTNLMKSSLSFFLLFIIWNSGSHAQNIPVKLKFDQGQQFDITMKVKSSIAQQAMNQAIDFNMDAIGNHSYTVTNTTDDNSTLHHQVKRIRFEFDGMGQKRSFDSESEKDMNGNFGQPVKDILARKYDMIIDPNGTVLMTRPDSVMLNPTDSRFAIISAMMKDLLNLVQPPSKDKASFFKIIPAGPANKGDAWTDSIQEPGIRSKTDYIIRDISDSTIVIDFSGNSATVTKTEMMGNETIITLTNKSTGKIILDRATGLIMEKTMTTDSHGNTEGAFGTLPVNSKSETTITVKPVK